jgi:pimeloyl-ACP methyl ester carboxylesterase
MAKRKSSQLKSNRQKRLDHNLGWKKLLAVVAIIYLSALTVLQAFPGLLAKFDDPARLRAPVQILTTNGFTLRWAEKIAATNRVGFDLVFIHGSPGGAGVWATQFETLATNANLFAYDRPGFGKSKPVLTQPHLQMQVDALMSLLACATTNQVLLVGHSYGSPIALLATLEHPEKIRGALLIGGDVDPAQEKPFWVQYIFGWRVTSWMLPHALRQCNREMLTVRADLAAMRKRLPQLAVPVVMLHGDRDPLVPVENVAWLEQQLGTLGKTNLFAKIILPGVNHFIPWEHPAEVERALRQLDQMTSAQSLTNSLTR